MAETGNGPSVAFLEDDVDVSAVKAAISVRGQEIGLDGKSQTAPESETICRVMHRG